MAEIRFDHVSADIGGAPVLKDVSLRLGAGELTAIIGPNGAGKTTLLKCAPGRVQPTAGNVTLDGAPVASLAPLERARRISYLPQMRPLAWPVRVRDVVALGRFAYGAAPGALKGADAEAVARAVADCGLEALAARRTDTLSGGELARMHCARAFAAETPLLLADEPVAALDPHHQWRILALIRKYVDQGGGAAVVMHDISLAARFADRLVWMKDGAVVADGAPAETLTATRMAEIYDVVAEVRTGDGAPDVRLRGLPMADEG